MSLLSNLKHRNSPTILCSKAALFRLVRSYLHLGLRGQSHDRATLSNRLFGKSVLSEERERERESNEMAAFNGPLTDNNKHRLVWPMGIV